MDYFQERKQFARRKCEELIRALSTIIIKEDPPSFGEVVFTRWSDLPYELQQVYSTVQAAVSEQFVHEIDDGTMCAIIDEVASLSMRLHFVGEPRPFADQLDEHELYYSVQAGSRS